MKNSLSYRFSFLTNHLSLLLCLSLFFQGCKKEESIFAVANFSYSGDKTSLPASIQFINNSFGISYKWDFGDGNNSTSENPIHIYNEFGLYSVKLVVEGSNNIDSMSSDILIGGTLGQVSSLNCDQAQIEVILKTGDVINQHSVMVPYTGGNGGVYNSQNIASTGVAGFNLIIGAGTLENGDGSLHYKLTGTSQIPGLAKFNLQIEDVSCELSIDILDSSLSFFPTDYLHCNGTNPTEINEVLNPSTGRIWMDRNLGASRVANGTDDVQSYGDLFQWGRFADGHQCRNSSTTSVRSDVDQPPHDKFIISSIDWRNPNNDNLWQGANSVNNPCPSKFRLPTEAELNAERNSWPTNNSIGAFNSPLKLPSAGYRLSNGTLVNGDAYYWTTTVNNQFSRGLEITNSNSQIITYQRVFGFSARCIKE
jgi:PKD repeat protein